MKHLRIFPLFLVLALVLAACAGGNNGGQGTPGAGGELGTPGAGSDMGGAGTPGAAGELGGVGTAGAGGAATAGVPVTGETVTPEVLETITAEVTEAATLQATTTMEGAGTGTGSQTGTPAAGSEGQQGGQGLADAYPNSFSELNDYTIVDGTCRPVADVDGFIVSRGDGQIMYVVGQPAAEMQMDGRLLLPWNALDANMDASASAGMNSQGTAQGTPAAGQSAGTAQSTPAAGQGTAQATGEAGQVGTCAEFDNGQALRLNIAPESMTNAPTVGEDGDLNQMVVAEGWDDEFNQFWSGLGIQVDQAVDANQGQSGQSGQAQTTTTPAAGQGTETAQGTPAAGQSTQAAGQGAGGVQGQLGNAVYLRDLGDVTVRGTGDEEIGEVADFVIDPQMGQITHALLSVGGFLGIGESYVPVPWQALNWTATEDGGMVINVNADQEQLQNAPAIESMDNLPSTQDEGWSEEFDTYWMTGVTQGS